MFKLNSIFTRTLNLVVLSSIALISLSFYLGLSMNLIGQKVHGLSVFDMPLLKYSNEIREKQMSGQNRLNQAAFQLGLGKKENFEQLIILADEDFESVSASIDEVTRIFGGTVSASTGGDETNSVEHLAEEQKACS